MRKEVAQSILKITDVCNLDCTYCYDKCSRQGNKVKVVDENSVRTFIKGLSKNFKHIEVLILGGEPLAIGHTDMERILKAIHESAKPNNSSLSIIMQVNFTLYDDKYKAIFEKYNVGFGVSYDGLQQKILRGADISTKMVNYNVKSCLSVLSDSFLDNIKDEYINYKKVGIKQVKLAYLCTVDKDYETKHISKMNELFDVWLTDPEPIMVESFIDHVDSIFHDRLLKYMYKQCESNTIALSTNGSLNLCSDHTSDYRNIQLDKDVNAIDDILFNDVRLEYIKDKSLMLQQCFDTKCILAGKCNGGCNTKLLNAGHGKFTVNNPICRMISSMHKYIESVLMYYIDNDMIYKCNPIVRDLFCNSKYSNDC